MFDWFSRARVGFLKAFQVPFTCQLTADNVYCPKCQCLSSLTSLKWMPLGHSRPQSFFVVGVAIMPTGQQLYSPTGFLPVPMSSPSGYAAGNCLHKLINGSELWEA